MLEENINGAVSPVYVVLRPKENYHWFLKEYIRQNKTKKLIEHFCSGTVRQNLDAKAFMRIECITPPLSLIKKYNMFYIFIKSAIDDINKQVETLSQIRDTLLPKLMSGEIRVKV